VQRDNTTAPKLMSKKRTTKLIEPVVTTQQNNITTNLRPRNRGQSKTQSQL
jgi:hypothetical protein